MCKMIVYMPYLQIYGDNNGKILTVSRKSHHSIENLQYSQWRKNKTQRHF